MLTAWKKGERVIPSRELAACFLHIITDPPEYLSFGPCCYAFIGHIVKLTKALHPVKFITITILCLRRTPFEIVSERTLEFRQCAS